MQLQNAIQNIKICSSVPADYTTCVRERIYPSGKGSLKFLISKHFTTAQNRAQRLDIKLGS
jgi:hypothetical protein